MSGAPPAPPGAPGDDAVVRAGWRRWADGWRVVALAFVAVALVAVARVAIEASTSLRRGQALEAEGDFAGAVFHYRAAAKWYLPLHPANREALEALLRLAAGAEARETWMDALHAYDAVRVGTLGTRWLLTPHADLLERANARLPDVLIEGRRTHPLSPPWRPEDEPSLRAEFEAAVQRDFMPPRGLAFTASAGFGLWLVGVGGAIWRGVRPEGGVDRPRLIRWGILAGVGLVSWLGALTWLAVSAS